jgi:hypothetical protein
MIKNTIKIKIKAQSEVQREKSGEKAAFAEAL